MVAIRLVRPEELFALQRIERLAGAPFRALAMDAIADDEPLPIHRLAQYQQAGRAWLAQRDDELVAYLLLDVIADAAHIEQVSVDPQHARQRIGQQLIETAAAWARTKGLRQLTLTTFAHVPWNGPYYTTLGFTVVDESEQPPELRAIRAEERAQGLDRWPRVVMLRQLS